jgi:aminopeptidase N
VRSLPLLSLIAGLALAGGVGADTGPVPTGRLPRTLLPTHYTLTLELDPAREDFSGEVRIQVRLAAAAQVLFLHGKDLDVTHAEAIPTGAAAIPLRAASAHESGVLSLRAEAPLPAGELLLALSFRARFSEQLEATYKVVVDGRPYLMTQFEPLSARKSFPCFDEPSFKAPWDVTLVVPADAIAVANTRALGEDAAPDGRRRIRFATTAPLPSYLIAYAVGPWDVAEAPPLAPTPERSRALPLRGLARRGGGPELAFALAETPRILAALERWFGLAYPFDKLDLLAAPDFGFGAMENAGLIVYQERLLRVDERSPTALRQGFFQIHAHELAHQWFGNLVTMPWWDDVWLNEAFATWLAAKLTAELEPTFRVELRALEAVRWAMTEDALASARRIAEPIADYRDVISAFDGVTYQKGRAVLGMFEAYLGEERFRAALAGHLRRFAGGNASSADLVESLAAVSSDRAAFRGAFRSFLDQPGTPRLDVALSCTDAGPQLRVAQQRDLPFGSKAPAARHWGVPLCVRLGGPGGTSKHCALVAPETSEVALPGDTCPRWVMPNADGAGYYRFTQPAADRAALEDAFAELNDREQLMAADAVVAGFEAGRLGAADVLRALPKLAASRSWPAASVPLGTLEWLRDQLAGEAERGALDAETRRFYGPRLVALGLDERAGEPDEARLERQALVDLLARAGDVELRAALVGRARAALAAGLAGTALAPDLRGSALAMLAQDGTDADFTALEAAFLAADDAQLRRDLLNALGAALEPGRAERVRTLALEPAVRSGELATLLGAHFGWPENRTRGRAWFYENADALLARLPAHVAAAAPALVEQGACSERDAREVAARFAAPLAQLEGGPRALTQLLEQIRLCAALRAHLQPAGLRGALP